MTLRLTAIVLLMLAGCSDTGRDDAHAEPEAKGERGADAASSERLSEAPEAVAIKVETERYSFSYDYPAEAAAIPALKTRLAAEAEKMQADTSAFADEVRRDAEANGFDFLPHAYEKSWKVSADIGRLLALAATGYGFTGGAHGSGFFDSLIWDRQANRAIAFADLFADPAAALEALRPAYCVALDAERKERRGSEPLGEPFDQCPALAEQPVALNGKAGRISTITVMLGPYVAGPYAEGSYEIGVPLNREALALVKPAYARAFGPQPQ